MSMSLFLDYLGILVDSPKAEGFNFKINIVVPDRDETHLLEMSHATLTNIEGRTAKDADLTLTIGKVPLMQVMMGAAKLTDLIESGAVKAEGDMAVLGQLKASMGKFDPLFEIMPGTKGK
jgi:alkyl sulfatase BDS1-like metallo-beta-lactamase superfamily hydrolase